MTEEIIGKTIVVNKPSYELYSAFSDLRNITAGIPEEYRDKVTAESDSLTFKVQGFELGIKVNQRTPFSRIDFCHNGAAPFPFLFTMFMEPADDHTTYFHLELRAELNMMLKMMLGKKLQEVVDKMTEAIAQAASGQMPQDWSAYVPK